MTTISPWTVVVTAQNRSEVARSALRPGLPLQLGRAPDCTIMLPAMQVQRYHGRIELSANGIPKYVADKNAPAMIDGDPVEGETQLGERTLLELGGYSIRLERNRTTTAAAPARRDAEPAPASDVETLLDRQIQGVRMHRNIGAQETAGRAQKFEADWKATISNLRAIKARYGTHPMIIDFSVAKDDSDATVKLKEQSPRGYAYFVLSRAHPEGRYRDLQACWLREIGREDMSFDDPSKAFQELISRLAPRLA